MRECEGEELERRLRRVGVNRGLDQAREMGMANALAAKCERAGKVLKAPVVEPPDMASPLGADDAQGASPLQASSAKEGAGTMVKPWAAPLSTNSQGTQNVRNHRRHNRQGEASPLEGLAFSCAMHAGRQLDLAEAASVCCRSEALARPKIAV